MFGFAARTKAVTRRFQSLAQLNIELAKAEGKQKATALGMAGALGALAAVLAIYGIGFAFATAAAGLSEALPLWLSLLIVTVVILVLAAIAGLLARRSARKASPPKPSQAIEESACGPFPHRPAFKGSIQTFPSPSTSVIYRTGGKMAPPTS